MELAPPRPRLPQALTDLLALPHAHLEVYVGPPRDHTHRVHELELVLTYIQGRIVHLTGMHYEDTRKDLYRDLTHRIEHALGKVDGG